MQEHRPPSAGPAVVVAAVSLTVTLFVVLVLSVMGWKAHSALCTWRGTLVAQQNSSREFLHMTPAERVAKFGSIGDIPDTTIQRSIAVTQHTIDSLSLTYC